MTVADLMDRAACAGYTAPLWTSSRAADRAEARKVCARCPVAAECLEYARRREGCSTFAFGIFGGLDEYERWATRRRSRAGWRERQSAA